MSTRPARYIKSATFLPDGWQALTAGYGSHETEILRAHIAGLIECRQFTPDQLMVVTAGPENRFIAVLQSAVKNPVRHGEAVKAPQRDRDLSAYL